MKNFKIFYDKNDDESYEEWTEREPKERRSRKFRKKREIDYMYDSVKTNRKLSPRR